MFLKAKIQPEMKLFFILILSFLLHSMIFADAMLDFYNSIADYDTTTISMGDNLSLVISGDYSFVLSGNYSSSWNTGSKSGSFQCRGSVSFPDPESKQIVLNYTGQGSSSYNDEQEIYKTKRDKGGTVLRGLTMGMAGSSTKRVYDHTEYYNASGSKDLSGQIYLVNIDEEKVNLRDSLSICIPYRGDRSGEVCFNSGRDNHYIRRGSKTQRAATPSDEFGAWTWNSDRSVMALPARNNNNHKLSFTRDGKLALILGQKVRGEKEISTDEGFTIVTLKITLGGGSSNSFTFLEKTGGQYLYTTYNRFQGQMNHDASSLLAQLRSEKMVTVSYTTSDGSPVTDSFMLEGLDEIMNNLGK